MRYRWLLIWVFALLLLPVTAWGQSTIKLHWQQYDTIVDVQRDGSLRFQEQQVLVVDQGPLRRMTRTFQTGSAGQVSQIRVTEDGQPYSPGTNNPGTYSGSDDGSNANITLFFRDPTLNRHTFTIEYTIKNTLIGQGNQATLDWNFFWQGSNAPEIRAGSVTINFPQQVNGSELQASVSGPAVQQQSTPQSVRWVLQQPIQGKELGVQATFPRTILSSDAQLRGSSGTTAPNSNLPANPATNPVPIAAPGVSFNLTFCVIGLVILFFLFSIMRSLVRPRGGGYPATPMFGGDMVGTGHGRRRWRRRHGGWGGGWGVPPIIIPPPNLPHDSGGPFGGSPDESAAGGSSSSWGDSGGSSSSWGDSGGSSSSWGDSGGGGSSWGGGDGGGGGGDGGGSGGGSFG